MMSANRQLFMNSPQKRADSETACHSRVSALAAEAFMNDAG
jgi:hypothetical protein